MKEAPDAKLDATRTVCPAVNAIDYSALESLEAINHRLKDAGILKARSWTACNAHISCKS
jgi:hypothetical protein